MSYLASNLKRLGRELSSTPLPELPSRLAAIARPKIWRLTEEAAFRSGAGSMLARRYRGPGIVLMFHEIHHDVDAELRTGCGAPQLERIILAVRAQGRDILSIPDALERLKQGDPRPFAVLTFDDAYRDNRTRALPVLERHQAPMTLFVPTGMIERNLYAWWLALREVLKVRDSVDIEAMEQRFETPDLASKAAAMRQVTSWIGTEQSRADALQPLFTANSVDMADLIDRHAMTASELKEFSAHPLVSIGAHTQSHRFLSSLSDEEVKEEFSSNKSYLENLVEQPVEHLAYPYGTEPACGQREADHAAEAGFMASFTTRPGQLFQEHLQHLQLLPRIDVGYAPQTASALDSRLSGLHRLMTTGFGNPVASLT